MICEKVAEKDWVAHHDVTLVVEFFHIFLPLEGSSSSNLPLSNMLVTICCQSGTWAAINHTHTRLIVRVTVFVLLEMSPRCGGKGKTHVGGPKQERR